MTRVLTIARAAPRALTGELAGTLALTGAAARVWDAIVIGAGPAGSLAAHQLARAGARVLLVDKAAFPRAKVCGCCLNGAAVEILRACGVGHVLAVPGVIPLREVLVAAGRARAALPLAGGLALSRAALDAGLIRAALGAGAAFLPRTLGTVLQSGDAGVGVRLERAGADGGSVMARATRIIVGDGLAGTALAQRPEFAVTPRRRSRFGAAAILDTAPPAYESGVIYMTSGRGGYVGAVRLEDGRLNVAAALDPALVRARGGPGACAQQLLAGARMPPIPHLADARWHGTPTLTRRRATLESGGVLVIGDAAGYVEPFTGEGMAWALASAVAVAREQTSDVGGDWPGAHARLITPRQRACRTLAWTLRRPRLAALALRAVAACPRLAAPMLRRVQSLPCGAKGTLR